MLSRLQIAARLAARPLRTNAGVVRTFSTTPRALSDHAAPPSLVGQGAPPGTVPTDENQSTGLERLQILGHHEGIDVFDMAPLEMVRLGTMEDPIAIRSWAPERQVGCTGYPADSHDTLWLTLNHNKRKGIARCPECGSVYKMQYDGPSGDHGHHH